MDEFVEKYNGRDALCLDLFYVSFGGNNRFCCNFIFSNPVLKKEFTHAMVEKYGEQLSKKWLFYQKNDAGQTHFPIVGEPCFDLEKGDIVGLERMLSKADRMMALKMVLTVAREMGIEVVERTAINIGEHVREGEKLKYEYRELVSSNGVNNTQKRNS